MSPSVFLYNYLEKPVRNRSVLSRRNGYVFAMGILHLWNEDVEEFDLVMVQETLSSVYAEGER